MRVADPICTFLFSGLVLATTVGLVRDASHVLMEGVPRNIDYNQVRFDLKSIDGVYAVHDLHIWSLTLDRNALTAHLALGKAHLRTHSNTRLKLVYQTRINSKKIG